MVGALHDQRASDSGISSMTDLLLVALTVALFAVTVGFARLCERM
jgi:hypothetical protein